MQFVWQSKTRPLNHRNIWDFSVVAEQFNINVGAKLTKTGHWCFIAYAVWQKNLSNIWTLLIRKIFLYKMWEMSKNIKKLILLCLDS